MSDDDEMRVEAPEGVNVKVEPAPQLALTPQQKLMADCQEIAMAVFQDEVRDGRLSWDFESRRASERRIEAQIEKQLFNGERERSPRVRLVRDKKTGLVSLELNPRRAPRWEDRLEPKST